MNCNLATIFTEIILILLCQCMLTCNYQLRTYTYTVIKLVLQLTWTMAIIELLDCNKTDNYNYQIFAIMFCSRTGLG